MHCPFLLLSVVIVTVRFPRCLAVRAYHADLDDAACTVPGRNRDGARDNSWPFLT